MVELKSDESLHCNIYYIMKEKCQYNKQNYDHIFRYRHHANHYEGKPICKCGSECKLYMRSENGIDKNNIEEKCHMLNYRHPPRTRQIKLAENMHSLLINKCPEKRIMIYMNQYMKIMIIMIVTDI